MNPLLPIRRFPLGARSTRSARIRAGRRALHLGPEPLEARTLLSVLFNPQFGADAASGSSPSLVSSPSPQQAGGSAGQGTSAAAASTGPFTPAQIRHAYGFDQIQFGSSVKGDGTGQTIAIIDAYNDPNITFDLQAFDNNFGLAAPPSLRVVAQDGSNNLPGTDPVPPGKINWEAEEALDVEWAHAMAPGARILVVETYDATYTNYFAGAVFAAGQPGVSVVSMSFQSGESPGETSYDHDFTTPSGHAPVTFVAASGDFGTVSYPAASPNVLAVGGTNLTLDGSSNISSETAWSGSGGGISQSEVMPGYQVGVVTGELPWLFRRATRTWRTTAAQACGSTIRTTTGRWLPGRPLRARAPGLPSGPPSSPSPTRDAP